MKWLLIFLTSGPYGDYAITHTVDSKAACVSTGENLLDKTRAIAAPTETQAYWCWPTSGAQVAYLAQEPQS